MYEASFNKDYYDKDSNRTYLDELVEKEGEKIFFISAYQSASKGLNPIVKNQKGIEKDFDSLVLLMDSYYTPIKYTNRKSKDDEANKNTTLYHFALMKSIVNLSESNIEIKDFNEYLSKSEANTFRAQQHQILLGKTIVQAIGRSERRYFDPQVIKIFINEETRKNLVFLYNYLQKQEPNEIRKLSVNNYEVYLKVLAEAQKRAIKNYEDHKYDEIDADIAFQTFRTTMLKEIELYHERKNNFDIKKVWDGLRDPIVFKDPNKYLDNLRKLNLLSDKFIDSLFYTKYEDSEFTPYLALEEEEGKRFQIISDSVHGERIYPYQQRLYPEHLKANSQGYDLEGNKISMDISTNSICKLYNKLIPQLDIFDSYIPRPRFFYDVLYPSLTESFVERWIKDIIFQGKDWKAINNVYRFEQLLDYKKYPQLYELFDLYYVQNDVLFCIDVKGWSKASGNRLSKPTVNKAKKKLKTIAEHYPEFKAVKGLLLNLHASQEKSHKHSATLCSGNLIYFNSQNCPVESTILRNFLLAKYNHHNVLTLTLTRKSRRFLPQDRKDYNTVDGEDLGELIVYKDKNYYSSRDRDARRSNSIHFMDFRKDKEEEEYDKFKKTQLYHHQNLMNKLEDFLKECKIEFEILDFQADHYLENSFIKNIEAVESLEIINNTGIDLTAIEQQFLQNFFKNKGISVLTFYNSGNTISVYEKAENDEDDPCWRITEVVPWSSIELNKSKNYLIFNKLLEEEVGSMAYQRDDGLWCPSTKIEERSQVDFYSQLKKRYNYLDTGVFYSIQGINIPEFQIIQKIKKGRHKEGEETKLSVFSYSSNIDVDDLRQDCQLFSNEQYLDVEDYLVRYLSQQDDSETWENFCKTYKLKLAPEFQKILIEIGIKNWIKQSLINPNLGLTVIPQSFSKQQFFAICVRSPKNQEAKAVAVEFLYQEGCIYLKSIMRDIEKIKRRFRFLRKQRNNQEKLINDQQYFVDESNKLYISCYTSDSFTPTLIGRHNIIKELDNGDLEVNRTREGKNSSKLLPIVSYYNSKIKPLNRIQNLICFDLHNESFIQYYVPPAKNLEGTIKKGFRVYHLIGKKDLREPISTSELIKHPMAALHFSTLTQNILKISDNSQSSLLQKIAKVLIEN